MVKKVEVKETPKLEVKLNDLLDLIETARTDTIKFDGGNKSAGQRVRKVLAQIQSKVKELKALSLGK